MNTTRGDAVDVVVKILENDVLLGRGAMAIGNEGNIRFRALVRQHQADYVSTSRRKKKERIADKVRATVADRHGRFLRRIESEQELQKLGVPAGIEGLFSSIGLFMKLTLVLCSAWAEADEATIIQKIKQSLRERYGESDSSEEHRNSPSKPRATNDAPEVDDRLYFRRNKRSRADQPQSRFEGHKQRQPRLLQSSADAHSAGSPYLDFLPEQRSALPSQPIASILPSLLDYRDRISYSPRQFSQQLSRLVQPNTRSDGQTLTALDRLQVQCERQALIRRVEQDREVTLQRLHLQDSLLTELRQLELGGIPPSFFQGGSVNVSLRGLVSSGGGLEGLSTMELQHLLSQAQHDSP